MKYLISTLIIYTNLMFSQNINNEYSRIEDGSYFYDYLLFRNSSEGSFIKYTHHGKLENKFNYLKNENNLILNCELKKPYNFIIYRDLLIDKKNREIYIDLKKYLEFHQKKFIIKNKIIESIDDKNFKILKNIKSNNWIVGYDAYEKYGYDYVLGILEIE